VLIVAFALAFSVLSLGCGVAALLALHAVVGQIAFG